MPVIRVSNETYQKLLRLQAEDGNAMSVFMDRFVSKIAGEPLRQEAEKKPRKRSRSSKKTSEPEAKVVEDTQEPLDTTKWKWKASRAKPND